jgi:heat shock protein 4
MKVLYTHSNKNLGARQIDYQLFDMLATEFEKKHGCDPKSSPRCRLRLLDAIEKMRKLLTSNKEADVICEALMEDEDLKRKFTRDELEELIEPTIKTVKTTLEEAFNQSGKYKLLMFKYANSSGSQSIF